MDALTHTFAQMDKRFKNIMTLAQPAGWLEVYKYLQYLSTSKSQLSKTTVKHTMLKLSFHVQISSQQILHHTLHVSAETVSVSE